MRTSKRFVSVAGATAVAALLAACGSPSVPMNTGSYPTTPYPTASNYPSTPMPGQTYPERRRADRPGRRRDGPRDRHPDRRHGPDRLDQPERGRDRAIMGGIIGAVVGNVVGKNINNGNNRTGTTMLGGAAGAAIGNASANRGQANTASSGAGTAAYHVTVQTDNGVMRTYEVGALGDLRVGDRVRVENGVIYRS
jgi:outer membrane lipoprotein SlyB